MNSMSKAGGDRALFRKAIAGPGAASYDVGCGAGGPARAVAAGTGCAVTGIDLTAGFITAGAELNKRCGLESSSPCTMAARSTCRLKMALDRAMMLHVGEHRR